VTVAVANLGTLERLCRDIRRSGLRAGDLAGLASYAVDDYVWARWGNSSSVQLARIAQAAPVALYDDGPAEWWWLQIYWPRQAGWRRLGTHRRVYRALHPVELQALREAGVIPR
jgi:hypothetical protein